MSAHDVAKVRAMTESAHHRFVVKQDSSSKSWMVWDRLLERPAMLKGEELSKLAFSSAETLKDTLNADNGLAST